MYTQQMLQKRHKELWASTQSQCTLTSGHNLWLKNHAQVFRETFLSNDKNKIRFIDVLKYKMENHNILVLQTEENADRLIITAAVTLASSYDVVFSRWWAHRLVGNGISQEIWNKQNYSVIYSSFFSLKFPSSFHPFLQWVWIHICLIRWKEDGRKSKKKTDIEKEATILLNTTSRASSIRGEDDSCSIQLQSYHPESWWAAVSPICENCKEWVYGHETFKQGINCSKFRLLSKIME